MNKNLRLTSSLDELADIVKCIQSEKIKVMIWQTIEGEKKILKGELHNYLHKNEQLYLDFSMSKNSLIIEDEKLYMFCEKKNILIKGKIKLYEKELVQIKVDKKFYLNEQRLLYRMDVTEKNIMMLISRVLEQQERDKQETVQLRNLCNNGCGFLISQSRATNYSIKNRIQIDKFGSIQLKEPIKGEIAHVTRVPIGNGLNENQYLVGFAFDETVPNIDHFLQMIEFGMTEF